MERATFVPDLSLASAGVLLQPCSVDWVTHAALGAAIGEWMLGRRMGNRALAWGALLGILPDLDLLLSPLLDTAAMLWWHRGPSHSLLVMGVVAWALAPWLAKLWKKDKISRATAGWLVFAVWGSHVLIDGFTVYGTAVLWPFSGRPVGFNFLFIIDLLFTLLLLFTVLWMAFLRTKKQWPKRRRLNAWGLGLAAGYALLAVGMKFVASAGFDADLSRRPVTYQRRMEAPTPFNILLWRSVVDRGDEFWVGYRTVFEWHSTPVRWTIYPKGSHALTPVSHMREVRALMNFTDGWWIARPHAQGVWVGDLRFCETRNWGDKKNAVDSRMAFAWDVLPAASGDPLRPLAHPRNHTAQMLKRMALRIGGNRAHWEANPRLAGITGSLPEFLAVKE